LDQISIPYFEFDDSFIHPDQIRKGIAGKNAARKNAPTPKPYVSAISLAACIKTIAGPCPLCGRKKRRGSQQQRGKRPQPNQSASLHFLISNCEVVD
jgi:hypothetical protein